MKPGRDFGGRTNAQHLQSPEFNPSYHRAPSPTPALLDVISIVKNEGATDSVVEHLSCMCKTLVSTSRTTDKKKYKAQPLNILLHNSWDHKYSKKTLIPEVWNFKQAYSFHCIRCTHSSLSINDGIGARESTVS